MAKGVGRGSAATKQQAALIRKLCIANKGEIIGDSALQTYAKLFERPLADGHIQAILALFGWDTSALPMLEHDMVVADRN